MSYTVEFWHQDTHYHLLGRKASGKRPSLRELWSDTTTLDVHLPPISPLQIAFFRALFAGLVLVLTSGTSVNGSRSWLFLPGGFSLQPAELAKIGLVIGLAHPAHLVVEPRHLLGAGVGDIRLRLRGRLTDARRSRRWFRGVRRAARTVGPAGTGIVTRKRAGNFGRRGTGGLWPAHRPPVALPTDHAPHQRGPSGARPREGPPCPSTMSERVPRRTPGNTSGR